MSSKAEEAAVERASEMFAQPVEEEPEAPSGDEEVVEPPAEEVEEPAQTSVFDFEPEVPEEILSDLEEDDPPPPEEEEEPEEEEDDDFVDPAAARMKRRAIKAEREAAYFRELRAKESRGKWEAEARKFFPLSDTVIPSIQADSRRAFLRQAQNAHNTILPFVKDVAAKAETVREKAVEEARAQARAEAEEAWGKPHASSEVPAEAAEYQAGVDRARQRGDLADTIKAMVFPKRS